MAPPAQTAPKSGNGLSSAKLQELFHKSSSVKKAQPRKRMQTSEFPTEDQNRVLGPMF
jgi:hypothetical protein